MARLIDPALLVGATEIADRMGLSKSQVVHTWRKRHGDFPEPVAEVAGAVLWYWPDVRKWAITTERLPRDAG